MDQKLEKLQYLCLLCSISEIECILSMENEDFTPWCNICIFPSHFSVVSAISVLHTLLWRHSSFTLSSYIRWQYLYFVLLNHNKRAKSVRIEQYLYFLCHILVTRSISANPNFFEKKNYLVKKIEFQNATSWHHRGMPDESENDANSNPTFWQNLYYSATWLNRHSQKLQGCNFLNG